MKINIIFNEIFDLLFVCIAQLLNAKSIYVKIILQSSNELNAIEWSHVNTIVVDVVQYKLTKHSIFINSCVVKP